uniref:Uncharacterized protein n=1 Tax=Meloidogyne enterolobii TaxID=390850 RepID=A0A6V7XQH7_MELEN|nr:unnamed protein product [Meloidogyne enterolobii]
MNATSYNKETCSRGHEARRRKKQKTTNKTANARASRWKRGNEDDPQNIRQPELLSDLRNAIIQICAYFSECNEKEHCERQICTQADYSLGLIQLKNEKFSLLHEMKLENERQEL